jgi:hypothetical protein
MWRVTTPPTPTDPLFIKDLIRRVHAELYASCAERERAKEEPLFQVDSLALEVNFVVTRSAGVNGGLDFKIITAGAKGEYEQQQVHKVTLMMSAIPVGGASVQTPPDVDNGMIPLEDGDEGARFRPRL